MVFLVLIESLIEFVREIFDEFKRGPFIDKLSALSYLHSIRFPRNNIVVLSDHLVMLSMFKMELIYLVLKLFDWWHDLLVKFFQVII